MLAGPNKLLQQQRISTYIQLMYSITLNKSTGSVERFKQAFCLLYTYKLRDICFVRSYKNNVFHV